MSEKNTTDHFKKAIEEYLLNRAIEDEQFALSLEKKGKTLDGCVAYILATVQKSGRQGFTDDEVYSMAVHYYDEDDIKANDMPSGVKAIVNFVPELTEQEKKEIREKVINEEMEKERMRLHKPKAKREAKKEKPKKELKQSSLF